MNFNLKGFLYNLLIDPHLAGVRASVVAKTDRALRVVEIACGTGSLALDLADKVNEVIAIDLDQDLISYAAKRAKKRAVRNIHFYTMDASDLSIYSDKQFDIAVTSLSVHQFEAQLAVKVLSEMKRVASKVIIADYNYPLPENLYGKVASAIERMAGGDHYRNFRSYMKSGGLKYFTSKAGLGIKSTRIRGRGVFLITICI